MRLGDLTTITRLGAGAFGTVSLVKHDSSYYALKQMNKSQIVQMGLQVGPSALRLCKQSQRDFIQARSRGMACPSSYILSNL